MQKHVWKILIITALVAIVGSLFPMAGFADSGNTYLVELEGSVDNMPTGTVYGQWQVAGVSVQVDALTFIGGRMGTPTVGAWVKVQGMPDGNGGIIAQRIKVDEMKPYAELKGHLDAQDANSLTVAGIRLVRDQNTIVMGNLVVGSWVKVYYTVQPDGSLLATQVRAPGFGYIPGNPGQPGTPTPTPTPPSTPMPGIFVEFRGVIESMPTGRVGTWVISGRNVQVTMYTWVDEHKGMAQVGAAVEVEGIMQADGSVLASKVEVERRTYGGPVTGGPIGTYTKFYGVIESLPNNGYIGTWVVSGRNVEVTAATFIEMEHGMPVVGARVEVKGYMQNNNSILADKIEVKSGGPGYPGGGDDDYPGQGQYIEFRGQVQSMPAGSLIGDWVISGRTVRTSVQTRFKQEHGPFQVGAWVKVKGYQQADGSINAIELETDNPSYSGGDDGYPGQGQYVEFYGQVQSMPAGLIGTWVISGRTVRTSAQTRFEQEHGPFQVGAWVEVKGYQQADGSINATKMETKGWDDEDDSISFDW